MASIYYPFMLQYHGLNKVFKNCITNDCKLFLFNILWHLSAAFFTPLTIWKVKWQEGH